MKIHALEIPDERDHRLRWLEQQLVGIDLSSLVSELRIVHEANDSVSLGQILADQLPEVLESGLGQLDDRRVQQLLRNPDSLFELQEKILLSGSEYWQRLSQQPGVDFDTTLDVSGLTTEHDFEPAALPGSAASRPWYQHPVLISLATAAAVLFTTNLYDLLQDSGPETTRAIAGQWGWAQPGALNSNGAPDVYLNGLADAAREWYDHRPENAKQLAARIGEFRQGCSKLILAEHSALSATDKKWLVEKCQLWARKLEAHLVAVEAGESVQTVRLAADQTIEQLVGALRQRATEPRT